MNPNEDRNHVAFLRGDKAFRARRYSEAIAWFKEAIAEWAEDYQAHFALGNSYSEAGKHRKAEQAFREALRLSPAKQRSDIQFNLGNALFDQGNFADALFEFEAVPSSSSVHGKAMRNAALAREVVDRQPGHASRPNVGGVFRIFPPRLAGGGLTRR